MKRFAGVSAAILFAMAISGCNTLNRQPKLLDATIEPTTLKPSDSAVVTVKVVDTHSIISRVVATVAEDQRMKFKLHDDGVAPDEKPNDDIWSYAVRVPFMAPPGNFTLEITAYNEKGDAIIVKKGKKETGPLTASCSWKIEYPPDAPPASTAPTVQAQSPAPTTPVPAPTVPAPEPSK